MADFIQSEIRLLHIVQQKTPTKVDGETKPSQTKSTETPTIEEISPKGSIDEVSAEGIMKRGRKAVGKFAMARRGVRYIDTIAMGSIEYYFQGSINRATLEGNTRKASLIQTQKSTTLGIVSTSKAAGMAALTSMATGNWFILGMQAAQMAISAAMMAQQYAMNISMIKAEENKEITYSRYRQERLVQNTYRRFL